MLRYPYAASARSRMNMLFARSWAKVLAGVGLLATPAVSTNVWNRVAGDAMDLTASGFAATAHPKNTAVWGSVLFVMAATALDLFTARGLDRETGKLLLVEG